MSIEDILGLIGTVFMFCGCVMLAISTWNDPDGRA